MNKQNEIKDEKAEQDAYKTIREKKKKDPCYLCEQVDCEGCEYFK